MPLYDYRCTECGDTQTKNLRISNRELPTEDPCIICGGKIIQVILSAPAMGDAIRLGITRPDSGMKEVLQKIHERTPKSRLNEVSNLTRL